MTAERRTLLLLTVIDNALRTGSYMTSANYAFAELCDDLGIDPDHLPAFDPGWATNLPALSTDRSGGADLAEIRCADGVHTGCDHDPDRLHTAPLPGGEA